MAAKEQSSVQELNALANIAAKPGRKIIVVSSAYSWGAGATGQEAYRKAREEAGPNDSAHVRTWIFLDAHHSARIDDMGGLVWTPSDPAKIVEESANELGRVYRR